MDKEYEENLGATFTRMVTKLFKDLLRDILEAYMDDMVVKSKEARSHPEHMS